MTSPSHQNAFTQGATFNDRLVEMLFKDREREIRKEKKRKAHRSKTEKLK